MSLFAALLAGALLAPVDETARPRLHVETPHLDFGTLFEGEKTTRTFRLENRGDAPLVVDRIKPTCGCVAARVFLGEPRREIGLDKSALLGGTEIFSLAPGESADLEVLYDATGQPPLEMTKKVVIGSNDPELRQTQLSFVVRVRFAMQVHPRPLVFPDVRRGKAAEQDVLVQVADGIDLEVVAVENTNEVFDAAVEPIEWKGGARRYRVRVSVRPDAPVGFHSRTLVLKTDHEAVPSTNVAVQATVRSAVRFDTGNKTHESILSFGIVPAGERTTRSLEITNDDPSVPYLLRAVDLDVEPRFADLVEVGLEELERGTRYRVNVTALPTPGVRFFTGALTLRADHPDEPEKVVRFNVRVAPSRAGG